MNVCEALSCYLEQLRVFVPKFAQNAGVGVFWIYFVIGAIALLLFSRDRLDRSLILPAKGGDRSGGQPVPSGDGRDFEAFVRTFRPSEVCISRAFRRAWISYAIILVALYSAASFIIALLAGVMSWEQAFAGLLGNDSIQPASERESQVTFLATFQIPELDADAAIKAAAPTKFQDIAEWPLLVALMVVGLIPAIPGIARIEHGIRNFSLELAGIPRDVVKLWNQLGGTPIFPKPADQQIALLAALSNRRGELIDNALDYAGRFVGEATARENRDDLALCFLYMDWANDKKPWPEKEIQTLYSRGDLQDITLSATEIEKDLRHFVAVNALIDSTTDPATKSAGMSDSGTLFIEPGAPFLAGDRNEGIDLKGRWEDLSARAAKVADQVRAKVALYAERVDVLRKEGTLFYLYDWIERAKGLVVPGGDGQRRPHHARIVLLCTLIYAIFGVFAPFVADYFNGASAPNESGGMLLYVWTFGFPWGTEALACFLAASFTVNWLRDTSAQRLDWRRYGTSGWGWDYTMLALVTAMVAVFLILLANWLAQFAYISADSRFTATTLLGLLLDPGFWFNGLHLGTLTATVAVLAVIVARVSDLCDQTRSTPRLLVVSTVGLIVLAIFKFLEFAVPAIPILMNATVPVPLNAYFGAGERYELVVFVIVVSIWLYLRVRSRNG